MAETPAPHLIGVQRVVIACSADSTLTQDERRAICAQLVKKAERVTSLPVSAASAVDLDPTNLARRSEQLLIDVGLSARPASEGSKALAMTVRAIRPGRNVGTSGPLRSEASLVKVQQNWVVQGPVDAFAKLLGSVPPPLHQPVRSDS